MNELHAGFRIIEHIDRPSREIVEGFRGIPSSCVDDVQSRLYAMDAGITLVSAATHMAGPALTVKLPIGDNLMLHRAIDMAELGDVIVVDAERCVDRAYAGELMLTLAQRRGIGGIVVDGALRDVDVLRRLEMPVFCRGITPHGPYRTGPGEINVPVVCGGMAVLPGDIIVGDADGAAIVRRADAERVLADARALKEREDALGASGLDPASHAKTADAELRRAMAG